MRSGEIFVKTAGERWKERNWQPENKQKIQEVIVVSVSVSQTINNLHGRMWNNFYVQFRNSLSSIDTHDIIGTAAGMKMQSTRRLKEPTSFHTIQ
jgi:hypothetical protein